MQQIQKLTQTSAHTLARTTPFFSESLLTTFWYLLLLLVLGNLAVFLLHLLNMPEPYLAQFIYDDGYYYLVVAKNFYYYHIWTFDSGATVTSGFQPLYAYFLALLYAIFKPESLDYIHIVLCFNVFLILLPFTLIVLVKVPKKWALLAACAIIASSLNFSYNVITLVEWPLLVLFSSAYLAYLYHVYPLHLSIRRNIPQFKRFDFSIHDSSNTPQNDSTTDDFIAHKNLISSSITSESMLIIAIIGCLGSLTRFDFGAMPFALFCASICLSIHHRNYLYSIIPLAGLLGATIGALLVMLHGYLFTGHWLQGSAAMKILWTDVTGPSPYSFFAQLMSLLVGNFYRDAMPTLPVSIVLMFPLLFGFAVTLLGYKAIIQYSTNPRHHFDTNINIYHVKQTADSSLQNNPLLDKNTLLLTGCLFTIIGYCLCYSFNTGALQPWYTGNIIVPMVVILTGILSSIRSRLACYAVSLVFVIVLAHHIHRLYALKATPWVSQHLLYEAGNYLHQHPLQGKIGSWNAGIISYYQGQDIINLDGLMNDEIYPYAKADKFECYILDKHIDYIVDFTAMLSDYHKQRGGYTHNLDNWLIPIDTFMPATATITNPLTHHQMKLLPVTIFLVNRHGLAQTNQCN